MMMMTRKALPFVHLVAVMFMALLIIILSSAVPAESTRKLLQRGERIVGYSKVSLGSPNGCSHVGGSVSCIGRHG
ncbi:unnamed protein product [Linum trigynum]|uniref:Transmembrane protein n=1 Tax=Linum trigynum TaxID=586398 RepID=A0AAV2GC90_9ROSI